jgi:hypothetical protein
MSETRETILGLSIAATTAAIGVTAELTPLGDFLFKCLCWGLFFELLFCAAYCVYCLFTGWDKMTWRGFLRRNDWGDDDE